MNDFLIPEIPDDLKTLGAFAKWEAMTIVSELDAQVASERLTEISKKKKQMDSFRENFIRPQKRVLASFEEKIRDALRPFEALDKSIRSKLSAYMDSVREQKKIEFEEERERQLALAEAKQRELQVEALLSGDDSKDDLVVLSQARVNTLANASAEDMRQTIRTTGSSVAQSLVWQWALVDISKVPLEYLTVDEKKLNALVKTFKTERQDIPGIIFQQVSRVMVR